MVKFEKLWQKFSEYSYGAAMAKPGNPWELAKKILICLIVCVVVTLVNDLAVLLAIAGKPARIWHVALLAVIGLLLAVFLCK